MLLRRLSVTMTALAMVAWSFLAVASSASAATVTSAQPATHGNTGTFTPGGLLLRNPSPDRPDTVGVVNQEVESTNWSGYAATGSDGAFTSVSASWTQPTATCSSSGHGRRGGDEYAAFWVGLDGYSSDSVEQTGTDSDCDGRTPDYYGWYEMYPANPVYYTNPVAPGDQISASVTFSGSETYTLVLTDSTQGWTQTVTKNQSGLDRSSAEVITEAPSSNTGVLPLSDFGTVSYTGAEANGTTLASLSPTEIIMVDNSGAEKDSTSAISGGSFSNTWLRSN